MITIFLLTIALILLYLAYPFWLSAYSRSEPGNEKGINEITSVSVILLSYNGKEYLKEKIDFLVEELSCFQNYELIIVDDNSTDGSWEILDTIQETPEIKILSKPEHKGIPHSMNMGVNNAKYENIIFCDQRQKLAHNILLRVVDSLKYQNVGAVSGCISHLDNSKNYSFIRKHENFIKAIESRAGSLIGVYGPLYAIKKSCYSVIPEYIILDDLYLSLRILKTKQIELREDCQIIDENSSILYDYKRARRYLSGFLQIMKEKTIISDLNNQQKVMLMWHKYLRLLIPFFLFLCYISSGIMMLYGIEYMILFSILTILGVLSFLPIRYRIHFRLKNLIRLNILYFIALSDIMINDILFHRPAAANHFMNMPGAGNVN